jgi:methyltransferase (TIGR00027 family)
MAAARALESQRPDRLFDDPLAAAFAGREGFAWLDRMELSRLWGGPGLYIVVRTRFFDDFLLSSCRSIGARQIVLLAAGMDARAFRMDWASHTRLYELDRPEVLAAKEAVIARVGVCPACERHAIGVDLANRSWSKALLEAGYEAREPCVWLMEGLLFYMVEAAVHQLLDTVSTLAGPGSRLGADLVNRKLLSSPTMWPLLSTFAWYGLAGRFGTNAPEALFAEHGWKAEATQPGERGANYRRWPYPVAHREVPGVPRIFLVRARRTREKTP